MFGYACDLAGLLTVRGGSIGTARSLADCQLESLTYDDVMLIFQDARAGLRCASSKCRTRQRFGGQRLP